MCAYYSNRCTFFINYIKYQTACQTISVIFRLKYNKKLPFYAF